MFWIRIIAMLASLWQPVESQTKDAAVAPSRERPPLQCSAWTLSPSISASAALLPALTDVVVTPPLRSMGRCGNLVLVSGEAPMVSAGAPSAATVAIAPMGSADDDNDPADDDDGDQDEFDKGTGPWIGVQLAPVPKVLASHLKLDGERLMILNIAKDSPADDADLEQYDVVVELNGEPAGADAAQFAARIRKLEVDKPATLTVVREGGKKTVKITPGKRPKLSEIKYKFKVEEDVVEDTQESRGAMFRRGQDGQWQVVPMPAPPVAPVPPAAPGQPAAPAPPPIRFDIIGRGMPEGNSTFVIVESKDGVSTEIRRDADGMITVSRSSGDDASEKKVRKYKTADELKKADPAAWEMYRRLRGNQAGAMSWGIAPGGGWGGNMSAFNDPSVRRDMDRARAELERAMKQLNAAGMQGGNWQNPHPAGGRPDISFEQLQDGRIRVTTRDGDQELVQTYKDADELHAKRPGLYKRYQRLSRADESND